MRNALVILVMGLSACQQAAPTAPGELAPAAVHLSAHTVLPSIFQPALPTEPQADVVVPAGMLLVSEVARPRAQVRLGPGPQFELTARTLEHGTSLLVVATLGVWRKVLVPGSWEQGWVHNASLTPPRPNQQAWQVAMRHFPTVLVTRSVAQVRGFDAREPTPAAIPRGALFRELRRDQRASLVWLPQTNSVMWLSRKDVQ